VAQLLRLRAPPSPHDAADGVALALTHVLRARRPLAGISTR
jgi:Holliday junction resolvasome RuvABC endonuclease subunit